jgi:two-component system nitrogen regulation sensor histidine kinase GlnL
MINNYASTPNNNAENSFYEDLLASVGDGVLAIDKNFKVVAFNPAAQELFGFSWSQAQRAPFKEVFGGNELLVNLMSKSLAEGISYVDHQGCLHDREGHSKEVSIKVSPLYSQAGEIRGTVAVLRDVSKIRELEEVLKRADRLSNLGALSAGIAHEIKNPLSGIKGAAQLLYDEVAAEKPLEEYFGVIFKEVERLRGIVDQLLDLSRPPRANLRPCNLHQALDHAFFLAKEAVKNDEVLTEKIYDISLPEILGDSDQLVQVFLNLIKNALEAMKGGGKLTLITRAAQEFTDAFPKLPKGPEHYLVVEIADTGPGLTGEQQENLFTPFYTTKPIGTGLGLVLSLKLVEDHRGNIAVESKEGEGARFKVYLPYE